MSGLRFLAQLHGHIGWLAAASLLHPAFVLRGGRGRGVAIAASGLTLFTFGFGSALYPSYREEVKRALFVNHPTVGWAFERKEHLAFSAVALAVAGLLAVRVADTRPELGDAALRLARRAYAAAFVFAVLVAAIGTWVASVRSF